MQKLKYLSPTKAHLVLIFKPSLLYVTHLMLYGKKKKKAVAIGILRQNIYANTTNLKGEVIPNKYVFPLTPFLDLECFV